MLGEKMTKKQSPATPEESNNQKVPSGRSGAKNTPNVRKPDRPWPVVLEALKLARGSQDKGRDLSRLSTRTLTRYCTET
jgi:hypothetical protein